MIRMEQFLVLVKQGMMIEMIDTHSELHKNQVKQMKDLPVLLENEILSTSKILISNSFTVKKIKTKKPE